MTVPKRLPFVLQWIESATALKDTRPEHKKRAKPARLRILQMPMLLQNPSLQEYGQETSFTSKDVMIYENGDTIVYIQV